MAELFIVGRFHWAPPGRTKLRFPGVVADSSEFSTCRKPHWRKCLSNKNAIIQVVGAGSGASFDIEQARYNKSS